MFYSFKELTGKQGCQRIKGLTGIVGEYGSLLNNCWKNRKEIKRYSACLPAFPVRATGCACQAHGLLKGSKTLHHILPFCM